MFVPINMPPKQQSVPDARPSFMISFDPTYVYTDGEVAELTRNQRRKYNRQMGLARVETEVAVPKAPSDKEVLESSNEENGGDKGGDEDNSDEGVGGDNGIDLDNKEASPES